MSKRAAPSRSPSPARRRRHSEHVPQGNLKGKGKDVESRLDEPPSSQEGSSLLRSASGSLFSRFSFLSASTSSLSSSSTAVEVPKLEPTSPILASPVLVSATTSPSRQQVWYSSISNASISHNKHRRRPSCQEQEPNSPAAPQPHPEPQKRESVIVEMEDTFRELVSAEMDELKRMREEKERLTEEIEELRVLAELEGQGEVLREIRALRDEMSEIKTLRKEMGDLKAELEGVRAEVVRGKTQPTHYASIPISALPRISQPVQPQILRSGDTSLSSTGPLILGSWSQHSCIPVTTSNGTQVRPVVAIPSLPLATTGYTGGTLSAPIAGSSTQPQVVLPAPKQAPILSLVPTMSGATPATSTSNKAPPMTQATSITKPLSHEPNLVSYARRFQHTIYTSTKSRVVRQQTAFGIKIPDEVFDEKEFRIPMWIWQKKDGDGVKVKQEEVEEEANVNTKQNWEIRKRELAPQLEEVSRRYLMGLARVLADAQRAAAAADGG